MEPKRSNSSLHLEDGSVGDGFCCSRLGSNGSAFSEGHRNYHQLNAVLKSGLNSRKHEESTRC